jgi:hypothetical protein
MTTISPDLAKILRQWQRDYKAPDNSTESYRVRHNGLCYYVDVYGYRAVLCELTVHLQADCGTAIYPFNTSHRSYWLECDIGAAHTNPRRKKWVAKKLAEYRAANRKPKGESK